MSVTSWVNEFYKKQASAEMSDEEAVRHALKKFEGATNQNLKKHNVKLMYGLVTNGISIADKDFSIGPRKFNFDHNSCSLCLKYANDDCEVSCEGCPIFIKSNKTCMDNGSCFITFIDHNRPRRMINLLNKILEEQCKNQK